MNSAHWHLVLNHIPVLGTLFGFLTFAYGWWIDSRDVLRVALALLFVAGLIAVPVYYTGHNAEEMVEELSGISEQAIEHHEEAAETTYYLMIALGIVALAGLIQTVRTPSLSKWWLLAIGLLAIVSLGSLIKTANDGGKIRHSEINMNQPAVGETNETEHEHEH
jgi:hypothetical protein